MRWNAKSVAIAVAVIVALTAGGFFATRGGPAFGQSLTIGWVDMARALDAHPRKASAETALKEYAQTQIGDAQQRMKAMTPVQRQDLQRQVDQDIFKRRAELLGGLDKDLRAAIEKVARQQGISLVLSREVVLYGGVDLTDQVIKVLTSK